MPEMYYAAAILSADPALNTTTAIVTDGRYSGAMKGPCIGHVAPEAIDGGLIELVADGDLIEINAPERRLAIVGVNGDHRSAEDIEAILAQRRSVWKPPRPRHRDPLALLPRRPRRLRGGVPHVTGRARRSRRGRYGHEPQ